MKEQRLLYAISEKRKSIVKDRDGERTRKTRGNGQARRRGKRKNDKIDAGRENNDVMDPVEVPGRAG